MSCTNITDLPEECISHILPLTSPIDIVRSFVVSKKFLSTSESNAAWCKFSPSNLDEIVSQSSTPHFFQRFLSKKQQFIYLCCSHLLFNNDTKSSALDKRSSKKCYMFGARALYIMWGDTPEYWTWKSLPDSRFPEIAELLEVCWLLIEATIEPTILSQNTTYGAYFVYKMNTDYDHGFESSTPIKAFVYETFREDDASERPRHDVDDVPLKILYLKAHRSTTRPEEEVPYARADGWMEVEMGRHYVSDCVNDKRLLKMLFREYDYGQWKGGLIVHGIGLRPLD